MRRRRLGALLVVIAVAIDVVACYELAGAIGERNDLYPRWFATRLWLTAGQDLYSAHTDAAIRTALGQLPFEGDAFVFGFVYPAYVALLLAPLALLPFHVAATVWMLFIQISALGGAVLAWRAVESEQGLDQASPLPALVVAALLPATVMNVVFLQFSAPAFLALAGCWWQLVHRRPVGAGVLVVASLIKPQLSLLSAMALLARAHAVRTRRTIVVACAGVAVLGGASVVAFPGWIERFLASTGAYAAQARPASAATLAAGGSTPASVGLAAGVLGLVALIWWRSSRAYATSISAASLLTIWLVPPLYEWNSVLLLASLVPFLRGIRERGERAAWLAAGLLAAFSALTLASYARWPSESRLIWPVLALALYLMEGTPLGSQSDTSSAPAPSLAART